MGKYLFITRSMQKKTASCNITDGRIFRLEFQNAIIQHLQILQGYYLNPDDKALISAATAGRYAERTSFENQYQSRKSSRPLAKTNSGREQARDYRRFIYLGYGCSTGLLSRKKVSARLTVNIVSHHRRIMLQRVTTR